MKKINIITLFLIFLTLFSCKDVKKSLMSNVNGRSSEVLVVMNKNLWNSSVGDSIKSMLRGQYFGLPQPEPNFSLLNIPKEALSGHTKNFRNLIECSISKSNKQPNVGFIKDVYAKSQLYIQIKARNTKEFLEQFTKNKNKIISLIKKAERERIIKTYKKLSDKTIIDTLKKTYKVSIAAPAGYTLKRDSSNFVWIAKDTPKIQQGLFIYFSDYNSQSQFEKNNLVLRRDSLYKINVPGPSKGSYMTTEKRIPISFRKVKISDYYVVEFRGLWKLEKDFMGGPFINCAFLDKKNNRVINVEGYVYAPNEPKRDLLNQIEAIIHTLKIY